MGIYDARFEILKSFDNMMGNTGEPSLDVVCEKEKSVPEDAPEWIKGMLDGDYIPDNADFLTAIIECEKKAVERRHEPRIPLDQLRQMHFEIALSVERRPHNKLRYNLHIRISDEEAWKAQPFHFSYEGGLEAVELAMQKDLRTLTQMGFDHVRYLGFQ